MWIMLNLMQLWFLVSLININFPPTTKYAFKVLETVNFENELTSTITQFCFPESFFEEDPFSD